MVLYARIINYDCVQRKLNTFKTRGESCYILLRSLEAYNYDGIMIFCCIHASLVIYPLLSLVSTTRVDGPSWRVTGFHYVSTGRVDRPVDGLSTRLVETHARQHGQCWRVMETGHPSARAVNSGRQHG